MKKHKITITFEAKGKQAKKAYEAVWKMFNHDSHFQRTVVLKLESNLITDDFSRSDVWLVESNETTPKLFFGEVPTIPGDEGQPVKVPTNVVPIEGPDGMP